MKCQTFHEQPTSAANASIATGVRTCRTHGSWAYANATLAYAVTRVDGDIDAYYCADCAELMIAADADAGRGDWIVTANILSGEDAVLCDRCHVVELTN